ncbi:MAG: hypothetical protein LQ350_002426 [Teloschistes chrysophthalmus]|nr:MAG: hypothetical protein LQ350_002426 [Niorma chrysophthalma]
MYKMISQSLSVALLALLSGSSVFAAPAESKSDSRLLSRDTVTLKPSNCSDPGEPVTPSCWTSLKVADYLNNWKKTTRVCGESDTNGVGCCVKEEPWSTCFIRLSTGFAGDSCTGLWGDTYCRIVPTELNKDLAPAALAPARYLLNAIYAIHSLFSSYDDALTAIGDSTIKDVLDVFSKTSSESHVVSLRYELPTALTLGLTVASQTNTNNNTITRDISTLWNSALSAAPSVSRVIWPNDTDNSQTVTITDISISNNNQAILLQGGLSLLMNDIPAFLAFTRDGRFANSTLNNIIPRLVSRADDLADGLNTFVTSKFLQAQGYFATPSIVPMDRTAFETQNRCTLNAGSWCVGDGGKNVYYWSPATHRQYRLRTKGPTPIRLPELMGKITDSGWADAELLFDGNFNCTAKGNAGGRIVFVGEGGVVDASCVSQLPMYLECGTKCPTDVLVEGKCPFGFDGRC